MAESVVSFAVEKIGNLDLHSELRQVQALLMDVDARRERKEAVEECVAQLRDFAYDAEDVIERYYLKAALTEGQNIIKAYACFMAKCSCVQVHEVGTEIEGLKSRISDIGNKMQKYGIQPLHEGERKRARASLPKRTYAHFQEEDLSGGKMLIPNKREEVTDMRNDELVETVYMTQKQKRCIVVLDDIWTKQAWDSLQAAFPIKDTRSKLLITTRNKEVAEHINPHCFLHEPQCLSHEESWILLKKRAFPEVKAVELSSVGLGVGRGIAVDQVVEGIARQSEMEGQTPDNEWETVYRNINLHLSDKSILFEVLALSYDDLPWHLKPCFLYLGSFPEDAKIPVKTILRMWIAEGFVLPDDAKREITMEDVAEQYFMELVKRGLVQTSHERFLSFRKIQHDNEREGSSSMACRTRRISLTMNGIGEGNITLRFLRVLKLDDLDGKVGSLPESVGDLVHLRFLSLARSGFTSLPQSMGNLACMEFLDLVMLQYIRISIPNVLWKMRWLRYLRLPYKFDVKEKFHGAHKKLRLGTLKNLQTLRNFSLKECDVNDVGKLTNLQKLTVVDSYDPQLAKFNLKHLQSLTIYFAHSYNSWTEGELSKISNYPHSCKLFINGKIEKLPEHKSLPQQLRKLVLICSQLKEDPMPILEKLKSLVFLFVGYYALWGNEMVCSAGGFPQLKHLIFYALPNLEEWRAAEGAAPHLSRLGIEHCPKLRVVPSHVSTYYGGDEIYNELKRWPQLSSGRGGRGA
ncbi:hypothetical protein EUGRSUZ_E00711 [Eucalyptus grandis]|uniref:NB-ARC domain-containing protein n=2 Tax=Eucalyptus grandis TaxID=71139 RepID=A0A059C1B1_EUCGR|nr:hypothetical protein EUGRSUZ_E00711 [Eucalyptus grandis]